MAEIHIFCGNLLKSTYCELHNRGHQHNMRRWLLDLLQTVSSLFESSTRHSGPRTLDSVLQEEHLQLPGWQVQLVQVQEALEQAILRDVWVDGEKVDVLWWMVVCWMRFRKLLVRGKEIQLFILDSYIC
jgi:hypothetical protein